MLQSEIYQVQKKIQNMKLKIYDVVLKIKKKNNNKKNILIT